jgi:hypothetical protein
VACVYKALLLLLNCWSGSAVATCAPLVDAAAAVVALAGTPWWARMHACLFLAPKGWGIVCLRFMMALAAKALRTGCSCRA